LNAAHLVAGSATARARFLTAANPRKRGRLRPVKGGKTMPNGRKRKRKKIATHKRKKRLRKNRHKKR